MVKDMSVPMNLQDPEHITIVIFTVFVWEVMKMSYQYLKLRRGIRNGTAFRYKKNGKQYTVFGPSLYVQQMKELIEKEQL